MGLFPDCAAIWLYEDWLQRHTPDPTVGLPLLRSIVADIAVKNNVWSTRARLMSMARQAKHGKWSYQRGSTLDLVSEYPDGLSTSDQGMLESVIRASWMAWFGAYLEDHQEPRLYRQLYGLLERPSAWVPDIAGLHLRPIVDARIVLAWLITRDEPDLFRAYQEHGRGSLKLLREHLKEDMKENPDQEEKDFLDVLNARVNAERDEWFQPVNLGSFAAVGAREMAIQAGLKREYDLFYAPLSSGNHGEWPTVREIDTVPCREALHRGHRLGAFQGPGRTLSNGAPLSALGMARDGITQASGYFDIDVEGAFEPLEEALHSALSEGSAG